MKFVDEEDIFGLIGGEFEEVVEVMGEEVVEVFVYDVEEFEFVEFELVNDLCI
ncbi:hypothetical protein [Staphylococcus saprophyticus]|uniref:hypothetical protein n=1 Tax=Staphylococcus saprophyticus TaxID=29385 RepID=UPI0017815D94|nr:hypothetical protein [Staphylococcus saprophyticus]